MIVFDPVRRRWLTAFVQLSEVDGVVPMRGPEPGDPWFAHRLWTNESVPIESLPESTVTIVRMATGAVDLCERLRQRCDDVRGLGYVPPMSDEDAREMLQRALSENAQRVGVEIAVEDATRYGFSSSEIAFALHTLDSAVTLSDALDGVEVVSVGQLAEMMRTRG